MHFFSPRLSQIYFATIGIPLLRSFHNEHFTVPLGGAIHRWFRRGTGHLKLNDTPTFLLLPFLDPASTFRYPT